MTSTRSATVGITLSAAITAVLPISIGLRIALSQPALTLESLMACRVFRKVLLGLQSPGAEPGTSVTVLMTTFMAEPDCLYDTNEVPADDSPARGPLEPPPCLS